MLCNTFWAYLTQQFVPPTPCPYIAPSFIIILTVYLKYFMLLSFFLFNTQLIMLVIA